MQPDPAPGRPLERIPLDDPRWLDLVRRDPRATPFHHPAWAGMLAECYGFEAFVLADLDGDAARGGLPVVRVKQPLGSPRWASLPFTDAILPLAADDAALAALVPRAEAAVQAGGVRSLEVRGEIPGREPLAGGALRHVLDLDPDPARVLATFHPSQVRRNLRKAEQGGLEIVRAESAADLVDTFFDLHVDTRARLGAPVQPRRFFRLLWERILEPGMGFLLLARAEGRPVAGAVFLHWNRTVIYKFGASRREAWGLRPNHLLFWRAIEWACTSGHAEFDFGRTDHETEGLRQFKLSWGTRELPLRTTVLGEQPTPGRGRAASWLGAVLRRSPPWAARWVGAALYRFSA